MILLSHFDAFGEDNENSTEILLSTFKNRNNVQVVKLPTVFKKSGEILIKEIEEAKPSAVIMLGQAGGRTAVTPEKVAINIMDARIKDNEGNKPCDEPIIEGGPTAYFSTLPVREITEKLRKNGIPATISYTAGTFVCNSLFYQIMHYISENALDIRAGFIHFPYLHRQVAGRPQIPSMGLIEMQRAMEIILDVVEANS
ncbi:pyroglutamyl-peptidase I [Kosmotoga sp.]|uniref:pyroglutamyl-peptidase I n=1 Tax=Kosmotoga sp. TaxID=1955248 RepID=UPI0024AB6A88|nr:pyroglutamyl-peptidase I [Kosmotoga sp.]MDI3524217.1 pyroglutamyl-peptidase [Kosmotoga sp.]MDK2953272.1 pyroglutamyl-peptidase [Kosmotoga sp.]